MIPKVWTTAGAKPPEKIVAASEGSDTSMVTAGSIDMSAEVAGKGLCPECRKPMEGTVHANSIAGSVCHSDRIFLPNAD